MSNPGKEAMITLHVALDGIPIDIATHATVDQLPAMVQRLRQVGCTAPGEPTQRTNGHQRNGTQRDTTDRVIRNVR